MKQSDKISKQWDNNTWHLNLILTIGTLTNGNVLMREDGKLYFSSRVLLLIKTGGSERMRILGNGNVGIDTSPDYKLDVAGDINFTGTLYQNGSAFSGGAVVQVNGQDLQIFTIHLVMLVLEQLHQLKN